MSEPFPLTCTQFYGRGGTGVRELRKPSKTWNRTKGDKMKLSSVHWTNHKSESRRCCSCRVDGTYTARGSVKTSVWMCIIRSPPAVYSMTKHTCSGVWKHANKLTRKGWCDMFTISKMRFSHIRLREEPEIGSGRVEETHTHTHFAERDT